MTININSVETVCPNEACPVHNLCARYAFYLQKLKEEQAFAVLNVQKLDCTEHGCKFMLVKKMLRMARGFRRMFDSMPAGNTGHFWHCTPYMSESTYCRAKRGAILIAPDMQRELLALLRRRGADVSIGFDGYEDQIGYVEPGG